MSRPAPADARELLEFARLAGIQTYELRGERGDHEDTHGEVPAPEVAIRVDETQLETRMRFELTTVDALLVAAMSAVYTFSEPIDLTAKVVEEFIERVAVMAVYPFIRESIVTTAQRLGVPPPVLGLLHAGKFHVGALAQEGNASGDATPSDLATELGVSARAIRSRLRESGRQPESNGRWELNREDADEIRRHFTRTEFQDDRSPEGAG